MIKTTSFFEESFIAWPRAFLDLLNDLKFLNVEINALKSRYNIKLTVVQLNWDLSSPLSDTQGQVVI